MTSVEIQKNILTQEQESCVNFDAGDLLIRGVAGSGKSYVILKRAVKLYKEKEKQKSVAIFTYANSLVKYTDDLITAKLGESEIEVLTVDSYCMGIYCKITGRNFYISKPEDYSRLVQDTLAEHKKRVPIKHRFYTMAPSFFEEEFRWIREKCIKSREEYVKADRKGRGAQIRLSNQDKEIAWSIYALFQENAKRARYLDWPDLYMFLNDNMYRIPEDKKIDYILVDEAQDMTVGKLRLLKGLTRESLTIAADVAQKIYKTSFTWKEVGIDISGRSSKSLSKSFRSTKQIVLLAEDLMAYNRKSESNSDEYTVAVLPEQEGLKPRLVRCNSMEIEKTYLINLLKGYDLSKEVVGIICRTDRDVDEMRSLLSRNYLGYEFVDKKKKSEAKWSLLRPGIKVVKAHSSKGLEFDRVIIPYLEDSKYPYRLFNIEEEQMEEYMRMERSILYVVMTRARKSLTMICYKLAASRFIGEFDSEHYEVENV